MSSQNFTSKEKCQIDKIDYWKMFCILIMIIFLRNLILIHALTPPLLDKNLPKDLSALWIRSQVLIYHNSNQFNDCKVKKPDCFGNILTSKYVLTVASCFIELTDTGKCHNKHNLVIKKNIGSIKNTIIAKVHILDISATIH